jgi:hypothetical protein
MRDYARQIFERLHLQLAHTLGCEGFLEEPATAAGSLPRSADGDVALAGRGRRDAPTSGQR